MYRFLLASTLPQCPLTTVFVYRQSKPGADKVSDSRRSLCQCQDCLLGSLRAYAPGCRTALLDLGSSHPQEHRVKNMVVTVDIMEAELLCEQADWTGLEAMIQVSMVVALPCCLQCSRYAAPLRNNASKPLKASETVLGGIRTVRLTVSYISYVQQIRTIADPSCLQYHRGETFTLRVLTAGDS